MFEDTNSFESFSNLYDFKEEEEKKEPQFYNDLPLDPEWVLPFRKNIFGELVFFYPIEYQTLNFNPVKDNLRKKYKFKYPITREQEGKGFKPITALEVANGKEPNDSSQFEKELVHLLKSKKNEYEHIQEMINSKAILQRQIQRIDEKIKNSKHVIHDLTKQINEVSNKLIETNKQQIEYDEFQEWF